MRGIGSALLVALFGVAAGCGGAGASSDALEPQPSNPVERGAALYRDKGCASCHGSSTEGDVGPGLFGRSYQGPARTEAEAVIRSGRPGTSMPAFTLDPEELDALFAYLSSR